MMTESPPRVRKSQEAWAFVLLTIVLFPVLAVGVVAGWGFIVWMWQLVAGPPSV